MARKRASMREGPLAELFRATEAAQRSEGDEPVDEPLPPAAEADDQQTLILDSPPAAPVTAPSALPSREEGALEETVEHVMPTAPPASRREEAALEETVEHVHDFDVPAAAPVEAAAPVAEEPVVALTAPTPVDPPKRAPAPRPEPPPGIGRSTRKVAPSRLPCRVMATRLFSGQ